MSRRLKVPNARQWVRWAALIVLGVVVLTGRDWLLAPGSAEPPSAVDVQAGEQAVLDFFENRRSGDMVSVEGIIDRVLADDNDGSRHQRFILRLESGHTLLVAHNIDIALRVPLQPGERARVRGQYEWSGPGGVLHWTHHDPGGNRPGGWIEVDGGRYR